MPAARVHYQPGGLVDHEIVFILKKNGEGSVGGVCSL